MLLYCSCRQVLTSGNTEHICVPASQARQRKTKAIAGLPDIFILTVLLQSECTSLFNWARKLRCCLLFLIHFFPIWCHCKWKHVYLLKVCLPWNGLLIVLVCVLVARVRQNYMRGLCSVAAQFVVTKCWSGLRWSTSEILFVIWPMCCSTSPEFNLFLGMCWMELQTMQTCCPVWHVAWTQAVLLHMEKKLIEFCCDCPVERGRGRETIEHIPKHLGLFCWDWKWQP